MPQRFPRSSQALASDRFARQGVRLALAIALLGGWLAWFTLAEVGVYAHSEAARFEAARAAHPIEVQVEARIVELRLELGRRVRKGDVVAVLESRAEQSSLDEHRARIVAIEAQVGAIDKQIVAAERGLGSAADTGLQALEQARALLDQAQADSRLAAEEADRARALHTDGQLSDAELSRALNEARRRPAAAVAARSELARLEAERRTGGLDRTVELERLRRDRAAIVGQLAEHRAAADRLALELEDRLVRAPIDGEVAEVTPRRPGELARSGDILGIVVPAGEIKIVASFTPEQALGRVHPGQRAAFRLSGFPWAQYGALDATVTEVAGELRDDRVRVELSLAGACDDRIPLQHGLPGDVEIEVERAPPMALVLRAAGAKLDEP